MNVFEDLVLELRQENLLEDTVMDDCLSARAASSDDIHITEEPVKTEGPHADDRSEVESFAEYDPAYEPSTTSEPVAELSPEPDPEQNGFAAEEVETAAMAATAAAPAVSPESKPAEPGPRQDQPVRKGKEFFKKRAVAEVSSLQMVEHVLTGVEREYLKVIPNTFDDFKAKKALNNFLHLEDSVDNESHAVAEFELMQETEAWCTALEIRDKKIPVSSLRHYCENTRPALSSQAMLAIARFYRNLPYSEDVRSKFDYVMTRVFSRSTESEKRVALFSRQETLDHIKTLYADWSSIPLYSVDENDSTVMLAALSFDDLSVEAENASTFDQLIKSDFFGRLRSFKESISELFFAPSVTAAAIEANVRIGNAYVRLIASERRKMDSDSIQSKYGGSVSQGVSDATASALELVNILKAPVEPSDEERIAAHQAEEQAAEPETQPASKATSINAAKTRQMGGALIHRLRDQLFNINKWVLVFCGLLITATIGLILWSNYFAEESVSSVGVAAVSFEGSPAHEFVEKAKISREMLYVQLKPSWDALPKEKREDILKQMLDAGRDKGYKQVTLFNREGKMFGYASPTRTDVVMP